MVRLIKHPPWIVLAAIAYCAWVSRSVVVVWWTSPLEHFGWLPLLIWLWPARKWTTGFSSRQAYGIATAIAMTFLGVLASVNTLKLIGLAIAIGSLVGWSWRSFVWVICAISWLPTLGWIMVHLFPAAYAWSMLLARVLIAFAGVGVMMTMEEGYDKQP